MSESSGSTLWRWVAWVRVPGPVALRRTWLLALPLMISLTGCGTNVEELLRQSASALGRTYLDLLLTDLANDLADAQDRDDDVPDDGNGDGDGDGDGNGGNGGDGGNGNGGDNGGGSFDDLTGDPAAGEPLYASCTGCHCADASGDCLPGLPGLVGVSAETLDEYLRGDTAHPVKQAELTDQEIVDLEAYLASLGDEPGDLVGDAAAGEPLFASCGGCHCADASGGCLPGAPSLVGVGSETLDERLRGDVTHPIKQADLTDQEIADLEAYLASLGG